MMLLTEKVLSWYSIHKRNFPWRQDKIPYKIWVSEIMSQQTNLKTVLPYYNKFINQWSTLYEFSQSSLEHILKNWAGLGYYSRGKNMYHCAQIVIKTHQGLFPKTPQELKKLPGIGDYTSCSMASIAFDYPTIAIDGNIKRLFSRLFQRSHVTDAIIHQWSLPFIPPPSLRGDFTQALMEIGATVCTPKQTKCPLCPLQKNCQAFQADTLHLYPPPPLKKILPFRSGQIFWIQKDHRILCVQHAPQGLLPGMWGFPSSPWIPIKTPPFHDSIHHTFSHFKLFLTIQDMEEAIYWTEHFQTQKTAYTKTQWIPLKDLHALGLPTVMQKIFQKKHSSP